MFVPFLYVKAVKVVMRLSICAGSSEPSLLIYAISTKISFPGSNAVCNTAPSIKQEDPWGPGSVKLF